MAAPSQDGSRLPVTGALAVLLVLAGALLITQFPLVGPRRESPEKIQSRMISLQDTDARLWQDPFAAADQHEEREKNLPHHQALHDPWNLKAQLLDRDIAGDTVLLGVTVFGGPYQEDGGSRPARSRSDERSLWI
jgi:hypothetical protein